MDKKCVLVTGASSGLGKETATKLANEGYRVFAGVRKEEDAQKLKELNEEIIPVFIDVTSDSSVNEAVLTVSKYTGKLFALVNNAGIAMGGPVEFLPIPMLQKQFDVNVFGAIRVAQKFLPLLESNCTNNQDARIINISSMASYGVFPFVSPYCASKRALDMFFNSLLIENKIQNLKIISIKPGVVRTPIWDKSVDTCEKCFENASNDCRQKYEKELRFLADNVRKNNEKGLESKDIANLVSRVLLTKKPKLSYNIGKDSNFAKLLSFLPQDICNRLVKFGLKHRCKI